MGLFFKFVIADRMKQSSILNINKKMLDDLKIIAILGIERLKNAESQKADGEGVNYDKLN